MKKRLSEMRKSWVGEKRSNDESKNSKRKKNKTMENAPIAQTLEGSSSFLSISIPPKLSYFVRCLKNILSSKAIHELEAFSSKGHAFPLEGHASIFTILGDKDRIHDNEATSLLMTIALRDQGPEEGNIGANKARIKELDDDVVESEKRKTVKIKGLEDTMNEHEYHDLDLSWVYSVYASTRDSGGVKGASVEDTSVRNVTT
ncbi:hypothetical protein FNV43_RR08218 [Rhamnella rubrinervis]|uniref:Uncharacterized protein n=1 Tax=Rhamnella rubrinervis TaxID=2594499 RepID=A0A8K0MMW1_9ROSA|nr:hypothetical protein FNV43_RR08218 [Rhamnella rubrinervis]